MRYNRVQKYLHTFSSEHRYCSRFTKLTKETQKLKYRDFTQNELGVQINKSNILQEMDFSCVLWTSKNTEKDVKIKKKKKQYQQL